MRKAAGKVRVTGQLIDAANGVHLWADRYDRQMADVFAIQYDITNRVIDSVGSQIVAAEAARIRRKPPQSIDAWDLVIQALPHMWRANADEQRRAQDLLQQAIAIDPGYAHAHALLGWTHVSLFNLVVGRPLSAEGEAHAMTRQAEDFARRLERRFKLPVSRVDERFSSLEAESRLRGLKRKEIDSVAAQLLLEQYFDEAA